MDKTNGETLAEKVARINQEMESEQAKQTVFPKQKKFQTTQKAVAEPEKSDECDCEKGTKGWKIFATIIAVYIILLMLGAGTLLIVWLLKILFGF